MSTDNNPHPWSREGWGHDGPPRDEPTVPFHPAPQPTAPSQAAPQPSGTQATPQPTLGYGASAPYGQAFGSAPYPPPSPFGTPGATATSPRAKGRSRVAGVLAVAVLAAGVGGGAGFAASRLTDGGSAAITGGNSTQIVQADPTGRRSPPPRRRPSSPSTSWGRAGRRRAPAS